MTSQVIWFGFELFRTETDNHIEVTKDFGPVDMIAGEETDQDSAARFGKHE